MNHYIITYYKLTITIRIYNLNKIEVMITRDFIITVKLLLTMYPLK
jgi:hypothetical protein